VQNSNVNHIYWIRCWKGSCSSHWSGPRQFQIDSSTRDMWQTSARLARSTTVHTGHTCVDRSVGSSGHT